MVYRIFHSYENYSEFPEMVRYVETNIPKDDFEKIICLFFCYAKETVNDSFHFHTNELVPLLIKHFSVLDVSDKFKKLNIALDENQEPACDDNEDCFLYENFDWVYYVDT